MKADRTRVEENSREQIVRDHIAAENRHDVVGVIATFVRPRYELVSAGEVVDGPEGVEAMYRELLAAIPDMAITPLSIDHQKSSTIVRFEMTGTDLGGYRGAAATGRPLKVDGLAQYLFSDEALICCKRVYWLDTGPDPAGRMTRLGNMVSLSAVRRRKSRSEYRFDG